MSTTLGLSNLRLRAMDIMDFSEEFGTFDYIIAHGVYSWVPTPVQEKLFAICGRQLARNGIAYVSYNTLPGWRMRSVVRDAMSYHTRGIADARTRVAQARAMLDFLADSVQGDASASAYGNTLRAEAEHTRKQRDDYILHEHLEVVNLPEYFYQFIERAAQHGLSYLGEADFSKMLGTEFSPQVLETLARIAPDVLRREQFMDFLRARTFRETLLVRKDVPLTRKVSPLRVMALRVASKARPQRDNPDLQSNAIEEFQTPDGKVLSSASRMMKAALAVLADRWPLALTFDELCARARALLAAPGAATDDERKLLASDILRCYGAGRGRAAQHAIAIRARCGRATAGERSRPASGAARLAGDEPPA